MTGEVELPEHLIDAHSKGELVFFVGAGVSLNPPSNLPLFDDLAKSLAELAHVDYPGPPIDRFLGDLSNVFDVRRHTVAIMSDPSSRPNRNHHALSLLATRSPNPRIVTTNFDNHLTGALRTGETFGDVYYAPALPLGRDFSGLVHLHGSVTRPAKELVLTDSDFGHAYLTDAWASRFLQQMFANYTTLFVGYSHDDPILRYLAMGLAPGSRRYALTTDAGDGHWEQVGVKPIPYSAADGHIASTRALEAWNTLAGMGQLDHEARVQDIVVGGPPKDPVAADYLRRQLRTDLGLRTFGETARSPEWLRWLEDFPPFMANFTKEIDAPPVLTKWFADAFVSVEDHQGAALSFIQRHGQWLHAELIQQIHWASWKLAEANESAARRWAVLLATSVAGQTTAPLNGANLWRSSRDSLPGGLAPLRNLLTPYLALRPGLFSGLDEGSGESVPRAEVAWPASDHVLKEHWDAYLGIEGTPTIHAFALFEGALLQAYDLLFEFEGTSGFDGFSFSRYGIESHPQDRFRQPVDAVIDGIRDAGQALIDADPGLIERSWEAGHALFRRLAVHLLIESRSMSQDEKVGWILRRHLLYDYETKHEVYRLLQVCIPHTGSDTRSALLDQAMLDAPEWQEDTDGRHSRYAVFNLLSWLVRCDADWAAANQALELAQRADPDFEPRAHPDLDHWTETGVWGGKPPLTADELEAIIAEDGGLAALQRLLSFDYSERNFDGPTWRDALETTTSFAASTPRSSLLLWDAIPLVLSQPTKRDIKAALLRGWASALSTNEITDVLRRVASDSWDPELAPGVATYLLAVARGSESAPMEAETARARGVARNLWEAHRDSVDMPSPDLTGSFLGLNTWPGELANFWLMEISVRWTADQASWNGLDQEESDALLSMIGTENGAQICATSALAGDVFFLFSADPAFTTEYVFPVFSSSEIYERAWESYLIHPRWNNRFLSAGFSSAITDMITHVEQSTAPGVRNNFLRFVAALLSYADDRALDREAVLSLSVTADNGSVEPDLVENLAELLAGEDAKSRDALWESWVGTWLRCRFDGVPREPSAEQLEAWADLALVTGTGFPDAAQVIQSRPVGFSERFDEGDVSDQLLVVSSSALVSYLSHRLNYTSTVGPMLQYHLSALAGRLQAQLPASVIDPLLNDLRQRGVDV